MQEGGLAGSFNSTGFDVSESFATLIFPYNPVFILDHFYRCIQSPDHNNYQNCHKYGYSDIYGFLHVYLIMVIFLKYYLYGVGER